MRQSHGHKNEHAFPAPILPGTSLGLPAPHPGRTERIHAAGQEARHRESSWAPERAAEPSEGAAATLPSSLLVPL